MTRPTVLVPALVAALLALAPAHPARANGEGFVAGISDLPLMGGLTPVPGQDFVFDNPGGRIAEAVVRGPVEATAVRAFYALTLPQLGWRAAGPDRWAREGEALALEFPDSADGRGARALTVRFLLNPQ